MKQGKARQGKIPQYSEPVPWPFNSGEQCDWRIVDNHVRGLLEFLGNKISTSPEWRGARLSQNLLQRYFGATTLPRVESSKSRQ